MGVEEGSTNSSDSLQANLDEASAMTIKLKEVQDCLVEKFDKLTSSDHASFGAQINKLCKEQTPVVKRNAELALLAVQSDDPIIKEKGIDLFKKNSEFTSNWTKFFAFKWLDESTTANLVACTYFVYRQIAEALFGREVLDLIEKWKDYSAQGKINLINTAKLFIVGAITTVVVIGFLEIYVGLVGVLQLIKWFWEKIVDIIATCWEAIKTGAECVWENKGKVAASVGVGIGVGVGVALTTSALYATGIGAIAGVTILFVSWCFF